jgi:hypothetical protein
LRRLRPGRRRARELLDGAGYPVARLEPHLLVVRVAGDDPLAGDVYAPWTNSTTTRLNFSGSL